MRVVHDAQDGAIDIPGHTATQLGSPQLGIPQDGRGSRRQPQVSISVLSMSGW
jgi:hypothetical protein